MGFRRGKPLRDYNREMADYQRLTAIIERDADGYVALCPEYDIASQGNTIEAARANLIEAVTLFFECADEVEVRSRFRSEFA